jgi:hypothetical protein
MLLAQQHAVVAAAAAALLVAKGALHGGIVGTAQEMCAFPTFAHGGFHAAWSMNGRFMHQGLQYFPRNEHQYLIDDNHPSSAAYLAHWLAVGDVDEPLYIGQFDRVIPPLPANVRSFNCSYSNLDALPELPDTLTRLTCSGSSYFVSQLRLPAALTHLNCNDNSLLVHLPRLPDTLRYLNCSECDALVSLGKLPAALLTLDCCCCDVLTALPRLPGTLKALDCQYTLLQRLPDLPPSLTHLYVDECIPLPDAYPPGLQQFDGLELAVSRAEWRRRVAARHRDDRQRVAAVLPSAALLFV